MNYSHQAVTESLYIHWPFCPYKCHFCPFVALAGHDQFMGRYHAALAQEIKKFTHGCNRRLPLQTIYLGGGTPSTWPSDLLLDMFGILFNEFEICSDTEVTIEVNPGTVTPEQLPLWKRAGINRLSIGVQSLNDKVLKDLNRQQAATDVFKLLADASEHFDNISTDLIIGLPGIIDQEWKELLHKMITLPITHISVYFLTVHEDTPLYFRVHKQRLALPPDDGVVALYQWTVQFLADNGFEQYEISNFARAGYQSKHNTAYWQRKPCKAFGIGACSFDGMSRLQNEKNIHKYLEAIEVGNDVTIFHETLTQEQVYLEKLMLGIRQTVGIELAVIMSDLTFKQQEHVQQTIVQLQEEGFVTADNDRLQLTLKGRAMEHDIALRLTV